MASRKENLKNLFTNTRSRMIIIIVGLTLTFAIIAGILAFKRQTTINAGGAALQTGPGGISSTPGALNQSPEYARLQYQQNIDNAKTAFKSGKSSIPTIIDLKQMGAGISTVGPQGGAGGLGFTTLATVGQGEEEKPIWLQDLIGQRCSSDSFNEAIQNNVGPADLKQNCSCEQLRDYHYDLDKLANICSCGQLRMLGTTALEFKKIGFAADKLKICGFSACEMKGADFSASDLKNAGYSDGEMLGAGFSGNQIASSSGLPIGVSPEDIKKIGCDIDGIRKLKDQGVSASVIKNISSCDAGTMKAAGFNAFDLKNAGFGADVLAKNGFSPSELLRAGMSPKDLLDAGFKPSDLARAGLSATDIANSQMDLPDGVTAENLKSLGCNASGLSKARAAGVSALAIAKINGCTAKALKAAGYSADQLKSSGFSPAQLKQAGYAPDALLAAGFSSDDLSKAGFTPQEIDLAKKAIPAGMSANDIEKSGCSSANIAREKSLGLSAASIMHIANCSSADLKAGGFTDADIDNAKHNLPPGVSVQDVQKAGCSADAIKKEHDKGIGAQAIMDLAGCSVTQLAAGGFNPSELTNLNPEKMGETTSLTSPSDIANKGCSIDVLRQEKAQGVSAEQIMTNASCTSDALKAAGFSASDIAQAEAANGLPVGISSQDVKSKGCDPNILRQEKAQGVSAATIMKFAGCTSDALKSAGFDPSAIHAAVLGKRLPAGINAYMVKNTGCSADSLRQEKAEGVSAAAILEFANCSADALKAAGYDPNEVSSALVAKGLPPGILPNDVKKQGCSPAALEQEKAQGISAVAIMTYANCTSDALKAAGFAPADISNAEALNGLPAGVTSPEVKAKGCNINNLREEKAQGVSIASIQKFAGCSPDELKAAGFDANEVNAAAIANGLPAGVDANDVKNNGCSIDALSQEKAQGVSAEAIMTYANCTSDALKAAGFDAGEVTKAEAMNGLPAGISSGSVKANGCNINNLRTEKSRGVNAENIIKFAGCDASALKAAGFTDDEIKGALNNILGFCEIQPIIAAGCNPSLLSKLNVSAAKIVAINHCNAQTLKSAGFNASELLSSGFNSADLQAAGFQKNEIDFAFVQNAEIRNIADEDISKAGCQPLLLGQLRRSGISASRIHSSNQCSIQALKNACFSPGSIISAGFTPDQLQSAGFSSSEIQQAQQALAGNLTVSDQTVKASGCRISELQKLNNLGIGLMKIQSLNHCSLAVVERAGFCLSDILASGFSPKDMTALGVSQNVLQQAQNNLAGIFSASCPAPVSGVTMKSSGTIGNACNPQQLAMMRANGVDAKTLMQTNKCDLDALKAAGFTPSELMDAGLSDKDLSAAGFSPQDIQNAVDNPLLKLAESKIKGCSLEVAQQARASGMSSASLRTNLGCSAATLSQAGFSPTDLKNAGFSAGELANAGIPLSDLIKAGISPSDLRAAGYSAKDLLAQGVKAQDLAAAGYTPADLLTAGLGPKELLAAGLSPEDLKKLNYSVADLAKAGITPDQLTAAGFTPDALRDAGISTPTATVPGIQVSTDPTVAKVADLQSQLLSNLAKAPGSSVQSTAAQNAENLQKILDQQNKAQIAMRFQQKIQQKTAALLAYANNLMSNWKQSPVQAYVGGTPAKTNQLSGTVAASSTGVINSANMGMSDTGDDAQAGIFVKSGDILFAVIDTAVNTDEPSPILATITNGPLKGSKLIGSFNLPGNADKMIITFTTLSMQGISKTISISAYAIDPNTGRTALSSTTNHHYLMRYGALFASTFIQGFGNAFQSADTTITIGGTGGTGGPNTTTVQNGIGRSLTSNAVIGLATLGQAWAQQAQQNMNVPTTVQVFSGTPIGVLFLQDVAIDPNQTK